MGMSELHIKLVWGGRRVEEAKRAEKKRKRKRRCCPRKIKWPFTLISGWLPIYRFPVLPVACLLSLLELQNTFSSYNRLCFFVTQMMNSDQHRKPKYRKASNLPKDSQLVSCGQRLQLMYVYMPGPCCIVLSYHYTISSNNIQGAAKCPDFCCKAKISIAKEVN